MLNIRLIPVLLLKGTGLVKTRRFARPTYIGDPINAVHIFNDMNADELIFLDITKSRSGQSPDFSMISEIANECFMPFCYGGGVRDIDTMKKIFYIGAEKIALGAAAFEKPCLIGEAAKTFGSQSIVVVMDVKKNWHGQYRITTHSATRIHPVDPVTYAKRMADAGAGELLVYSVDRDGMMNGYDIELLQQITRAVNIPVIACGGAGNFQHFRQAITLGGAAAVAAGSRFVFFGVHNAVLINYPDKQQLKQLFLGSNE